jgi:hypothetical protein
MEILENVHQSCCERMQHTKTSFCFAACLFARSDGRKIQCRMLTRRPSLDGECSGPQLQAWRMLIATGSGNKGCRAR